MKSISRTELTKHNILIIIVGLIVSALTSVAQAQRRAVYVTAGLGVEGITVGYSTKNSVTSKYGNDYALLEYNNYSYEIKYNDTGMSFWYRHDDPEQKIFSIGFRPESGAFTGRGIVVGRSTLQDVFNAYGKSEFSTTSAEETWFVEYQGIKFHVEYKSTDKLRQTPEKLLKRKIIEIEIVPAESATASQASAFANQKD
ncbi:MAG TPA: hypothetical protein VJ875_25975 [Pyrinomonadaceae bacterium]|nr:hypothetical protein [Pyrinomonadaceae bacterium]